MDKSKAISILKTFSDDEFREFGQFVASPVFNTEKPVIKLFDQLKKYYPDFNADRVAREKVYKKLYPGKKYSDGVMRNLSSKLYKLCEEYLAFRGFKKDKYRVQFSLLRELSERKLPALYEKNYKELRKIVEEIGIRDEEFFLKMFYLEQDLVVHLKNQKSAVFLEEDNAQDIADNLSRFFLVAIIKLYAYMANEKKFLYDYDFKMTFLDQIDEHLKINKDEYKDEPYIELFHNALNLFLHEKEETYLDLRKTLNKYYSKLENIDRKNMYVVLANYCAERIRKGNIKYLREKFELYKEIIKRDGQYEPGGFIHHIFYKRVVTNAIELGEIKWAENFIEKYKDDVPVEYRDSNYFYCKALIEYGKKEYGKALEMLSKVQTEDISYKVEIRTLLLMIYYDTEQSDAFDSTVDSFRHLITNNRLISSVWQTRERNFVNFAKRMFDLKMKAGKKDGFNIKKLEDEINSSGTLQNRFWLQQKCRELSSTARP